MSSTETRGASRASRRTSAPRAAEAPRSHRYRQLVNPFPPVRVFSDDEVEHLHQAALGILERNGIKVLLPQAVAHYAAAGANVSADGTVRLDPALVEQYVALAPASFTLHGQRPERSVIIGPRHVAVVPVAGPPNVTDRLRGRRAGTLADFSDFIRLTEHFDVLHLLGPSVEAQDIPDAFRHLEVTAAQLQLSDKVPYVSARGQAQVEDAFRMIGLAHGLDEAAFRDRPVCWTNINTNSPRQLDIAMAQGILDFAAAGQALVITPFALAGAMAPITLSGALTLAHAEALAAITLAQIVRPGTPVVYGSFTSNVDMKSGSPAFGTPEHVKASFGAGQLARRVGLPYRTSNATASNAPDEQATYESAMSLWGALYGGCNFLIHGAGWIEGGLSASLEKFIIDVELLQQFAEIFQPVDASTAALGLDAIDEVPPGGHFFAASHTLDRYRNAFYEPLLSDWRNIGQWQEDGAQTAAQRATGLWQQALQSCVAPARDAAFSEALAAFVQRRRAEGGALPVS